VLGRFLRVCALKRVSGLAEALLYPDEPDALPRVVFVNMT
jgi:hypothetical protein